MKHLKIWRSFLLVLASIGVAGCSIEAPTAPKVADQPSTGLVTDLLGGLVSKDALTRRTPLARDLTRSATIGREGGRLEIPAAGFELTVPRGAVKSPTRFTVTALKGKLVAYEFGPHGIAFKVALRASQDLSVTTWRPLSLKPLVAGYFLEKSHLDQRGETALLAEVIEGLTIPLTREFNWRIEHFSGYVVAW